VSAFDVGSSNRLDHELLPVHLTGSDHGVGALPCTSGQCRGLLSVAEAGSAPTAHLGTGGDRRHAQRYGTRRLRAELCAKGHAGKHYALRSWLRRRDLRALSTRPRTTVADLKAVVAENCCLTSPPPRPQIRSGMGRE
jgi:hypothetical protein